VENGGVRGGRKVLAPVLFLFSSFPPDRFLLAHPDRPIQVSEYGTVG